MVVVLQSRVERLNRLLVITGCCFSLSLLLQLLGLQLALSIFLELGQRLIVRVEDGLWRGFDGARSADARDIVTGTACLPNSTTERSRVVLAHDVQYVH